jgi:hypothetical protein
MLFPIDLLKAEVVWDERRRQIEQIERTGWRWPITVTDDQAAASVRTRAWRRLAQFLGHERSRPATEQCAERPRHVAV